MLFPSVGKEWLCTGRLWKPGRIQDMKTLLHMRRKVRERKPRRGKTIAPISTRVHIMKPLVGPSIESYVPRRKRRLDQHL
jgi:hypothetical protein